MRPDRPALVGNAADPHQVKRGRRVEAQRTASFQAALAVVLKGRDGRFVIWELLERAGLYETSLHPDPHEVYRREGRRAFGLELLAATVAADDERYLLMEREARARQAHEDRASQAVQGPPVAALTAEEMETHG
ncbi:MAG TPA: hypothetical protein VKE26_26365 [Xanthobacteraceae bacterium]|nr:hypothetical protein [Xanthobacteraceae bacterium]